MVVTSLKSVAFATVMLVMVGEPAGAQPVSAPRERRGIDVRMVPPSIRHAFKGRLRTDRVSPQQREHGRQPRWGMRRDRGERGERRTVDGTPIQRTTMTCPDSVLVGWVVDYGSGLLSSENVATAIAIDVAGNVYVTGFSDSGFTSPDYLTVKYNSAGVQQWVARYNGPGNDEDYATAIAVDAQGSVYVTGASYDTASFLDMTTIKYNATGTRLWVQRYNGPDNDDDGGVAIAIDHLGNPSVTGVSFGEETYADIVTVKYFTGGTIDWVRRYDGPGMDDDVPAAITTDVNGHVYVTGYAFSLDNFLDIVTIKYRPGGSIVWTRLYDGPEHDEDGGTAIAIDAAGNVYVAGYSSAIGGTLLFDYATLKYNLDGVLLWDRVYNGPGLDDDVPSAIGVDGAGNVFVTGRSFGLGTFDDFATVKYSASGVEQWVARYDGDAHDDDAATAMVVDPLSGGVFVTGYSYDATGFSDYVTIHYAGNGTRMWVERYDGTASDDDEPAAMRLDAARNLFVTGTSVGLSGDSEYRTLQYRTMVPCLSLAQSVLNVGLVEVPCAVTGQAIVRNGGVAPLLISSAIVADPWFSITPASVSVNPGDSVVFSVTFTPLEPGLRESHLFIVHNARGGKDSIRVFGTGVVGSSSVVVPSGVGIGWQLISVPVVPACPYVLSGAFGFTPGQGYYQADTLRRGRAYWKKLTTPNPSFTGIPISLDTIALTPGWNIVGTITTPVAVSAIVTEPESLISASVYAFDGMTYVFADSLRPGRGYWMKARQPGRVILGATGGLSRPVGGVIPACASTLVIADASGKEQVLHAAIDCASEVDLDRFELPPRPPEGSFDIRFASGRLLEVLPLAGAVKTVLEVTGAQFPLTARLDEECPFALSMVWNGEERTLYAGAEVVLAVPLTPQMIHRIPFTLLQPGSATPTGFALDQNYPNPGNPGTVIQYTIPEQSFVVLQLFDALGKEVATLVQEYQRAGFHATPVDGTPLASGLYFYRLTAGKHVATRKLLLIK